jgi:hypothetical protein
MNHLERGKDEYNQFWRYLVNFLSGMGASNILGMIPFAIVIAYYAIVQNIT